MPFALSRKHYHAELHEQELDLSYDKRRTGASLVMGCCSTMQRFEGSAVTLTNQDVTLTGSRRGGNERLPLLARHRHIEGIYQLSVALQIYLPITIQCVMCIGGTAVICMHDCVFVTARAKPRELPCGACRSTLLRNHMPTYLGFHCLCISYI